jgi:uncharacterized protein YuzE
VDKLRVLYDAEGHTLTVWVGDPTTEAGCDEVDDDTVLIKDDRGRVIGFEKLNVSMVGHAQDVTVEVLKGPVRGG